MKCSVLRSKGASESNVAHLLCPLFTLMCERDGYLGRRLAAKSERFRGLKRTAGI